ncbi:hypothetical protein AYO45_02870 [Gammaproteobacteria bacterium SCGC AG-212-F23]|nr:hypothetical protein AYO45_02870 [Gammaproteobacteria bacterium SCGC AG-212-F23]
MIPVVIAIIQNYKNQLLITQRPPGKYKPGLWEFPGGKIEAQESPFIALKRELYEELGITVLMAHSWIQHQHDYGDRVISLDTWIVTQFSGYLHGKENQAYQWITADQLPQFEFPEGNKFILDSLFSKRENSCHPEPRFLR